MRDSAHWLEGVLEKAGTETCRTRGRTYRGGRRADDSIRKPFDPRRFLIRVKAALRRAGVSSS